MNILARKTLNTIHPGKQEYAYKVLQKAMRKLPDSRKRPTGSQPGSIIIHGIPGKQAGTGITKLLQVQK